ncbi:MAG: ribbon-helix-helix domain-containing protein [Actinomycetota bacterium]|nr:ribbon-helix-helix domain-containing protein [Actinomycetota bacterium]MDQ3681038.1 ribbon-helix-helix domain-containing protein [Actinomycetota bacterium]
MTHKTTIYLPQELKAAIEREAHRRGTSEAAVIRDAITALVARPEPTVGFIEGEPIAERVDEHLAGFGER